mgnify:CR=1 FL=1
MGKINFLILLFAAVLCCNSCKLYKVTYSTTGASISPDVKTFSVDYFPNKAPLVVPYLSSLFTEKLTDYMRSKTGLSQLTDNNGDIRFEGQITETAAGSDGNDEGEESPDNVVEAAKRRLGRSGTNGNKVHTTKANTQGKDTGQSRSPTQT